MIKIFKISISTFNNLFNYVFFKLNRVERPSGITIIGRIFLRNKGKILLGHNIRINSSHNSNPIGGQSFCSIVVRKDAIIKIGNNVGISNSSIFCTKEIEIEDQVFIGGDCKIYDTDFHSIYLKDRISIPEINIKSKKVHLKEGAFIGGGSLILKGVTIGKESVIAAGSVVTKSIPDYQLWGGNPCKFIKVIK